MNLISRGDFVNQKTTYWCIPASTQTMMNIMDDGRPNRSRALQARLYRVGDRLEEDGTFSDEPEPDSFRGMGISEWVGLLNRYGYGPYELAGTKSRQNALRLAARMMRKTGKPVGLVVWRGAHAWVMSGFSATADPAITNDFTVTSVWVHDPWYPRVSSIWGLSRPPHARVSPAGPRTRLQALRSTGSPESGARRPLHARPAEAGSGDAGRIGRLEAWETTRAPGSATAGCARGFTSSAFRRVGPGPCREVSRPARREISDERSGGPG